MILEFSKQLFNDLTEVLTARDREDMLSETQFNQLVDSALRKCKLVPREEFDAQQAVLLKTREKLELLEKTLVELESKARTGK